MEKCNEHGIFHRMQVRGKGEYVKQCIVSDWYCIMLQHTPDA
jgi:hypothetical protein